MPKNLFMSKKFSGKEFLDNTYGSQWTAQAVRQPCEPILLSIGYFESPTEVQLKSNLRFL